MKLWGQVDLKPVLVTIISGAILGAGGYVWKQMMKVDAIEARMSRIEDTQEIILNRLPALPANSTVPAKGPRR